MTPRRDPVPRARSPWSWLGGILLLGILGGGVVAASVVLWENLDIQGLSRAPAAANGAPAPLPHAPPEAARAPGGFSAFVYRSEATAAYFPDPAFYPSSLALWERLLGRAGAQLRRVGSAAEVDALEGVGLLVAPAALCLDDAEVDAFHRHAEAGGDLVLTWATGARDGACEWRGWEVVRELTAADDVRELDPREAVYLTIPGGLPLSMGIEPAARVELSGAGHLALAAPGSRVYWSDWALNAAPAEQADGVDAAARLHRTGAGGRVAWFGFNGGEQAGPVDEARIERLFLNGLLWAAGVPSAELLAWPDGNRAALVLTEQVGWEFENARHLAELARSRDVPVTFFVISRLARDHPELAALLIEAGEVGSHTSDDSVLAGLPRAEQQTRLRRSLDEVETWAGAQALGLRPPEERFDAETLLAWSELGGSYVVALNNGRTGSPEILEAGEGRVVLLPRVMKDDYNVIVQDRAMAEQDLVREFAEGLDKLHALRGLAVLTVHTQVAGGSRRVGALGTVIDQARARGGWWMATGGEVAEWTLARRDAAVGFVAPDPGSLEDGRMELEVTAPVDRPLPGAWIEIVLPERPPAGGGWEPFMDGIPVQYAETEWGLAIPLGPMAAGESRRILLQEDHDLAEGEGDPFE